MKIKVPLLVTALSIVFNSCNENDEERYVICNSQLVNYCSGSGEGEFCTFGFKWGDNNPFTGGLEVSGPSTGPVDISYSFQNAGYVFNTHSQDFLTSKSFDEFIGCAREKVKEAFLAWESVANVNFIEMPDDVDADIKILTAEIRQSGVGYPAYPDEPCSDLAGQLVFDSRASRSCDSFFRLALHEVGHVLGLGHVVSDNIMNPDISFMELQAGDIEGVQSIYGER